MPTKPTLYIVDASSYIFRAYYALPHLSNSKGMATNAIYGFTQMLLRLIKDVKPEYLVMVFDSDKPTLRKQEYQDYKANRSAPPEDLVTQFAPIREMVRAFNITLLEEPGYEADDIIATIVRRAEEHDCPVVVVTGDKDLMQLVNHKVTLLDTMKNKVIDHAAVVERFGVGPEQVVEVLALTGDASDNVPGVPSIGPKTASQLIQQYGSVENLYEHLDEIKGKRQDVLRENREQAFLSKRLVTLHDQIPIQYTYEDFKRQEINAEACRDLFEKFEFHRLIDELNLSKKTVSNQNYHLVNTEEAFQKFLAKLKVVSSFAFDTETTSLNVREAELVGLSLGLGEGEAYYLAFAHKTSEAQLDRDETLQQLAPLLSNSDIPKYAQNYKYDAHILKNYGIEVQGLRCDTMLASYLLDPASSHKLDSLASRYLNHKMISYEEVTQKKGGGLFEEVSLQQASTYSCEDADVTWQLSEIFLKKIEEEKLSAVFYQIEIPLTQILLKMERVGIKIDRAFLLDLQQDFGKRILEKEQKIYELAGETFNIQSPKQLGVILFEKLKLPVLRKTKTGYSTDVDVLTELGKQHALPQQILDFRTLAKLKSTYVDALLSLADPKTDRIHTSFNQSIAETGRLSSSDPNLQNIPIRSEEGAKIRRAFIADQSFCLMSADYSQIELRVLAHFSKDPVLLKAYRENEDIHRLTASSIFGVAESEVTPAMRAAGKTVNFAVIYGQSPFGLSSQLGVTQQQAKKYIEQYFEKYQAVAAYRERILSEARQNKEVRTLMGRRRFVPDIVSKNFIAKSMAERIAFNTVIQGTAADIIKKAMIVLDHQLSSLKLKSRLLLQVHDELVVEVEASESERVARIIREAMEKVVDFDVPLSVEVRQGTDWGEAHA